MYNYQKIFDKVVFYFLFETKTVKAISLSSWMEFHTDGICRKLKGY